MRVQRAGVARSCKSKSKRKGANRPRHFHASSKSARAQRSACKAAAQSAGRRAQKRAKVAFPSTGGGMAHCTESAARYCAAECTSYRHHRRIPSPVPSRFFSPGQWNNGMPELMNNVIAYHWSNDENSRRNTSFFTSAARQPQNTHIIHM